VLDQLIGIALGLLFLAIPLKLLYLLLKRLTEKPTKAKEIEDYRATEEFEDELTEEEQDFNGISDLGDD